MAEIRDDARAQGALVSLALTAVLIGALSDQIGRKMTFILVDHLQQSQQKSLLLLKL